MNVIVRIHRIRQQAVSLGRHEWFDYHRTLKSQDRQARLIHASSIYRAKAEPVTYHVRSTNTTRKKNQNQSRDTYLGQEKIKGGKKHSLWQSWKNLTLGTKMGVAFAIGLVGVTGLITNDYLEQKNSNQSNGQDQVPKKTRLLGISVVDRK